MPYRIRCVEPGVHEVVTMTGEVLGTIRHNREGFWSRYPWSIDGQPCPLIPGGVLGKTHKRGGWRRLEFAAREVAVMGSGQILAALGTTSPARRRS